MTNNLKDMIINLNTEDLNTLLKFVQEESYQRKQVEKSKKCKEARKLLCQLAEMCRNYEIEVTANGFFQDGDTLQIDQDIYIPSN